MVALGQAVTILSDVAYRPWSSEGLRIEARPLQNGLPPVEIGLVWLRNRDLPPAAKTFCEFMRLTYSGPGLGIKVI
jgi:DNA-binding transcriptional LysR family regulator